MSPTRILALRLLIVLSLVSAPMPLQSASILPVALRCEYLQDPMGIESPAPRLFWKLAANDTQARGQRQTAYRILVASSLDLLDQGAGDLWDSGKVEDSDSVQIEYAGAPLAARQHCFWKARAWDENGQPSEWSEPAQWRMGLGQDDWQAQWIGSGATNTVPTQWWSRVTNTMPDPWLRKSFALTEAPPTAYAYIASMGYHDLYVNGQKVGDRVLAPAVSNLNSRALYNVYDIAPYLQPGENVIALWLGMSWSIFPEYSIPPDKPLVIGQFELYPEDETPQIIVTDASWKIHDSPNTLLGIWFFREYGGERYDMNLEQAGWNAPHFDDSSWDAASTFPSDIELNWENVEPNRVLTELSPVAIKDVAMRLFPNDSSSPIVTAKQVDMGRAYTGWTELAVRGEPGQTIRFYFSERPDELLSWDQRSELVLGPAGEGVFRNRFNYSSARYISIEGLDYHPEPDDFKAFLVRTDFRRSTEFHCSNPLLREIYDATLWTLECLSLGGYIVDCAQRERMGYGGDAHSATDAAFRNYDLGAFFTKWIRDWRDVQLPNGDIENTAPTVWGGGGPAWGGYCITLPWEMYQNYGDRRMLEENYDMMQNWIAFLSSKVEDDLLTRYAGTFGFLGDWVPPGKVTNQGDTPEALFFNNCYMIYNLDLMEQIAAALGRPSDAASYRSQADTMRAAVHARFYDPAARSYVNGRQAYLAMALIADVMPTEERPAVWTTLEDEILVRKAGHVDTGITGTWALLKLLIENDRSDLVLPMATQTDYPSWGQMLQSGSGVIWENWEGDNSLMHSSFLYIGTWFVESLAGIQPDPQYPGFERFYLRPQPSGSLSSAAARHDTLRGAVVSDWGVVGEQIRLDVTVPPNTMATLHLPTCEPDAVRESGAAAATQPGIEVLAREKESGRAILRLAAGSYRFEAPYSDPPPPPANYGDWIIAWSGAFRADESLQGRDSDPDHDGRSNFFEFALGTAPRQLEPEPQTVRMSFPDGQSWIASYERPARIDHVTYSLELSRDLHGAWTPVEQTDYAVTVTDIDDGRQRVSVQAPLALVNEDVPFFRLKVAALD